MFGMYQASVYSLCPNTTDVLGLRGEIAVQGNDQDAPRQICTARSKNSDDDATTRKKYSAVPRDQLQSRVVLHDGRLVRRPTATNTLPTFMWVLVGFALLRVHLSLLLPERVLFYAYNLVGIKLVVRGHPPPPPPPHRKGRQPGVLFVCNHRTALDPVTVAASLGRKVTCVMGSFSGVRGRDADAARTRIWRLLEKGDVVVFPDVPSRGTDGEVPAREGDGAAPAAFDRHPRWRAALQGAVGAKPHWHGTIPTRRRSSALRWRR
ncbi:hypothetical protein ACP70R_010151 [Stipagrostis hirtigluma subsp. patula]